MGEAVEVLDEAGGKAAIVEQGAGFDVAGLAAVGEVGGAYQGAPGVDDDALGVQGMEDSQGAGVVEKLEAR